MTKTSKVWEQERPPAHYNVKPKQHQYWPGFRLFYARYPRKESPKEAWKAFLKAKPSLRFVMETVVPSIEAHQRSEQWRQGATHIPYPSTFLNQARWEGDPPPAPPPPGSAPPMTNKQHEPTAAGKEREAEQREYAAAREQYVSLEIDRLGLTEFLARCAFEKAQFMMEHPGFAVKLSSPDLNERGRRRVEAKIAQGFPNIARWRLGRDKEKSES